MAAIDEQPRLPNIGAGGDNGFRTDEAMQTLVNFTNNREILETQIDELWNRYSKNDAHMWFLKKHFPMFDALHLAVVPIILAISLHYLTTDLEIGIMKMAFNTTIASLIAAGVMMGTSTYLCTLCKMNDFYLRSRTCNCLHHKGDRCFKNRVDEDSDTDSSANDEAWNSQDIPYFDNASGMVNLLRVSLREADPSIPIFAENDEPSFQEEESNEGEDQ